MSLVFARDGQLREQVIGMLEACVQTFLANALPLVAGVTPAAAWRNGLARSYATELRAEGGGRADDIVGPDAAYYELLTRACRPQALVRAADGAWLTRPDPSAARVAWLWRLRLPVGKLASVLRLIKGLYTFDGGLDYIAWKLSRHAGRPIDIPERVRRWPLIFIWGLMLRLYRQGVFR